jgi:type IV secretion system protein VirB5
MNKIKAFFSKSSQNAKEDNPYLNARRAWNSHAAGLMQSLHLWQFVGIGSLLIAITAVGGLISIGSQSKFIPLVFQQDASGNTITVTKADKVGEAHLEDYRLAVASFIENIRTVSMDSELQKKSVFQVYSFLSQNTPAIKKIQAFYNNPKSNPFERSSSELVSVTIKTIIQETNDTWQVDWIETVRTLDGEEKSKAMPMKAILTMAQQLESQEMENESLLKNPHLIVIKDFNWSQELKTGDKE